MASSFIGCVQVHLHSVSFLLNFSLYQLGIPQELSLAAIHRLLEINPKCLLEISTGICSHLTDSSHLQSDSSGTGCCPGAPVSISWCHFPCHPGSGPQYHLCVLSLLGLLSLLPKSEIFPLKCLAHLRLTASSFYILPMCLTPRFVNFPSLIPRSTW